MSPGQMLPGLDKCHSKARNKKNKRTRKRDMKKARNQETKESSEHIKDVSKLASKQVSI